MKKIKKYSPTKIKFVAGATALAMATQLHAQSSVDALLNKLEQKGILTSDETKELKAENERDSTNDFNAAVSSKFPTPDWVTGYKLNGDFRGRFDDLSGGNNGAFPDRERFRYRIRLGLAIILEDNLEVGLRLGSGDPVSGFGTQTGNPLSNNSSLQDDFTKKFVYIDTAYGKWTAINNGTWMLATTIGKMDNPFALTPMIFDPDLTPEGLALQSSYKINNQHALIFNGAAFVMDEEKTSSHDPAMFGGQIIWNAKWTPHWSTSLGAAAFAIANRDMLTTANVPYVNQGNTRKASGILVDNFNPLIADAGVTYTMNSFPLYKGAFPIKVSGEYMNNPAAQNQRDGYWGGVTFGKSGKKGTWDLTYRYEYLEANAWYDQVVDDDNVGAYNTSPVGALAGSVGFYGGTNVKGHLVKLNYSIVDSLTFSFTCFINELITPVPPNSKSDAMHVEADLMWKF